ncbi:unnamed protein product [Danaus chrysippus]|uniref:(African queen) hypothetical protein n=1 Tax=Danaus chrysippus TaxID=151541 RepID=A0A8J2R5R1_9NEOP|nr:unnamed protein product [Danaus chrysippus]
MAYNNPKNGPVQIQIVLNGQPSTKPAQSVGRFFGASRICVTFLRFSRHVRDVISGRPSPSVTGWPLEAGWGQLELMKFLGRDSHRSSHADGVCGTYCARPAITRYCPGEMF